MEASARILVLAVLLSCSLALGFENSLPDLSKVFVCKMLDLIH